MKLLTDLAGNISFALEHIGRQEKLDKLSRIRAVSSEINAAHRARPRAAEAFDEACRIAVEHGGFGIAWIGMLDQKTLEIVPAPLQVSMRSRCLRDNRNTVLSETCRGRVSLAAPSGRSARYSAMISPLKPVRAARAGRKPFGAAITRSSSLPLVVEDKVVGTLSLFAKEPEFFDDEEITLLSELASNISFALDLIQKSEALADSEKKLDNILGTLQEVVWSMDPQSGQIVYVNAAINIDPSAGQRLSCPTRPLAKPGPSRRPRIHAQRHTQLLQRGTLAHEFRIVLADGEERTVESSARCGATKRGKSCALMAPSAISLSANMRKKL